MISRGCFNRNSDGKLNMAISKQSFILTLTEINCRPDREQGEDAEGDAIVEIEPSVAEYNEAKRKSLLRFLYQPRAQRQFPARLPHSVFMNVRQTADMFNRFLFRITLLEL